MQAQDHQRPGQWEYKEGARPQHHPSHQGDPHQDHCLDHHVRPSGNPALPPQPGIQAP